MASGRQRRLGFHSFGGTMTMTAKNPFSETEKARFVGVLDLVVQRVKAVVVLVMARSGSASRTK